MTSKEDPKSIENRKNENEHRCFGRWAPGPDFWSDFLDFRLDFNRFYGDFYTFFMGTHQESSKNFYFEKVVKTLLYTLGRELFLKNQFFTGLAMNAVRRSENVCSCSVLCSAFGFWTCSNPCSELNVFGRTPLFCCVRCSAAMLCSVRCSVLNV